MVLDHATKSVVVSVRGSVSTADWVTDFLGIPEVLDEWLPDAFKEVSQVLGLTLLNTSEEVLDEWLSDAFKKVRHLLGGTI